MPYLSSKDKMKGQGGVLDNLISFQLQIFPGKNFTAQSCGPCQAFPYQPTNKFMYKWSTNTENKQLLRSSSNTKNIIFIQ